MGPRLIALAGCLAALSFAPGASGQTDALRNCGGGVRAAVVDCGKAKRIAKEYLKTGRRSIWSYTCSSGQRRGRCALDRKLVTFPMD